MSLISSLATAERKEVAVGSCFFDRGLPVFPVGIVFRFWSKMFEDDRGDIVGHDVCIGQACPRLFVVAFDDLPKLLGLVSANFATGL